MVTGATRELGRRGLAVNHKRVVRLMREDNLLAVQPRAFVSTTRSDHRLEVCLNLAARMKLTGINQFWVADITYIRLQTEFVYLAVVVDGYSRKVLAWELDRTLKASLAIAALDHARSPSASRRRARCITPTAASSTRAPTTRRSLRSTASSPA